MRRTLKSVLVFFALVVFSIDASAQSSDPMTDGILAFREGRYESAVQAFEATLETDPQNAEAHFLLARIFFETQLKNDKRAGKELDQALKIEPENVQYLVARMQQLRVESWNNITNMSRQNRRRALANQVLKIDSTNSFAHQELGEAYVRDFWRYRNTLMYPALTFNEYKYRGRSVVDPMAGYLKRQVEQADRAQGITDSEPLFSEQIGIVAPDYDPNSIFMADQFDVETLKDQGIPVVTYAGRAQRAYDRAIVHLNAALSSDPRQRSIYDDLMRIYALKGEYTDALSMLSQMYVFFPDDPQLWTYLGFAHYHNGNMEAASKAFESAFRFMAPDVQYAYSHLDDILPDDEKRIYEEDRKAYEARFWTSKDPRYLTTYNERKLEHYTRLTYADLLYAAPDVDLRGWDTQRGHILVRYGVPKGDVVIVPRSTSGVRSGVDPVQGTQSDPTGSVGLALEVARKGMDMDMAAEANTFNIWDYGDFKFVFEDPFRNGEYRLFSPSAADLSDGSLPWANDYTIKAAETFKKTPERYDYEAPGRQVEIPFLVTSFRNFNSTLADTYINFGVPVTDYDPDSDMINVTATAGTFIIGEKRDMLDERRKTIYGLKTDQIVSFDESNLWVDTEALRVPSGHQEVSVEFETVGGGTVGVQRRQVDIPEFTDSGLQISDILLAYRIDETENGRPVVPTDIVRNDLSIMPAPWSVFSNKQPIYLYFEVYNLESGTDGDARYDIEAVLAPKDQSSKVGKVFKSIFGGGDKGVSVSLPVTVSSRHDGQYLILDAKNQEAGLYTLVVRIKDTVSGEEVERDQDLFLE